MTVLETEAGQLGAANPAAGLWPALAEMAPPLTTFDQLSVLLVTPRYFPYLGGVENHVYQVARRMARFGAQVTVLTANPGSGLPASEQLEGVQILRVRSWPAKEDFYFAPEMYRVIKDGNWDIMHLQSYHTLVAPLAMFAALRANIPYVVTFHGGGHSSSLRNASRGLQHALLRPLLAHATRLVATARFEIGFFGKRLHLPKDRFVFIPNGSDISDLKHQGPVDTNGMLIASIGRLERYKGHHRIIAALPYILEQQPDARLLIAGSGQYETELRRLAVKLGVADRVEIREIPAAQRQVMAAELSKAALVTLLSEYETHPMAVLEALAAGRPVLVADTSGLSELAEQGLVRAIPLNSTPAMVAEAVLAQLRDPLIPEMIDLPTWDTCTADLLALYQSVVRKAVDTP